MKKNLLVILCLWFVIACSAFANQNTAVGVDSRAGAQAFSGGGNVTFAPNTTNKSTTPFFMPNGAAGIPIPNNFTKSPTLMENTNVASHFFTLLSNANLPDANVVDSPRAQTEFEKTDFALLVWQPYRPYLLNIPSERNVKTQFAPVLTSEKDIHEYFGKMSPEKTHCVLGHVAMRTLYDEEKQDITLPPTLMMEALRFGKNTKSGFFGGQGEPRFAGYSKIIPVVIFDDMTSFHGTAVTGTGISVTPTVTGGPPGVGVAGSMFNWGKNRGLAVESNGTGALMYFLWEAPNGSMCEHIAAWVQKRDAEIQQQLKVEPNPDQDRKDYMKGEDTNGGEKG